MHWGAQSRQYLKVEAGISYWLIGISDANPPWWYMAERPADMLSTGGWAPPTAFRVATAAPEAQIRSGQEIVSAKSAVSWILHADRLVAGRMIEWATVLVSATSV